MGFNKKSLLSCVVLILTVEAAVPLNNVWAQGLRNSPAVKSKRNIEDFSEMDVSPWSLSMGYRLGTDLAEKLEPRSYTHGVLFSLGYSFNQRTGLLFSLGANTQTVNGQIFKDQQQDYAETVGLDPSIGLNLNSSKAIWGRHVITGGVNVTPLIDEISQRQGYQGVMGANAALALHFWKKFYSLSQNISYSHLFNEFFYNTNAKPNPENNVVYGMSHNFQISRTFSFGANFGIKVTEYLDGFIGYSYNNSQSIAWQNGGWKARLSYENGGFTQDGQVEMWYLDKYRRLVSLGAGYEF